MADNDIFNNDGLTNPSDNTALEQLVGEGKKYKTVEELAKAYANADSHINELKTDLQSTREFIAEELKKLAEQRKETPVAQIEEPRAPNPAPAAPPNGEVEDLDTRIAKALENKTLQDRLQANANLVQDVLVERLGSVEAATEAVIQKARELGVDGRYMKETAANSPQAFFSLLGIDPDVKPTSSATPAPRSDVNPNMVNPNAPKPRTYKFHEEVRKSNPKLYNSVTYQQQLMKDAMELGDGFFN